MQSVQPTTPTPTDVEKLGFLVVVTAKPGKEMAVRKFLLSALPLAEQEPGTIAWYAFQIDKSRFGIYDTFSTEEGRQAHLSGPIAKALLTRADELFVDFDSSRDVMAIEVMATK